MVFFVLSGIFFFFETASGGGGSRYERMAVGQSCLAAFFFFLFWSVRIHGWRRGYVGSAWKTPRASYYRYII